jgi:hypothetical protein
VIRWAGFAAAVVLFVLVSTANSGGYRYGVSDQAFYAPAIAMRIDPTLFPRDRVLFAPQMRAWIAGDLFAWLARVTGAELPTLFAVTYLFTLVVLAAAAAWFARGLGMSWWGVGAFLLLLTLRHQITRTGANSLEGYMHPRVLAFAFGIVAFGFLIRQRHAVAALVTLAAGVVHPTTALWFAVVVTVVFLRSRVDRRNAANLALVMPAMIVVAVAAPFLDLRRMDPEWLAVLADKSYLFPSSWPPSVWAVNLAYPVALLLIYRHRRRLGANVPGEGRLIQGVVALVVLFLLSVPLSGARIAFAVQLQVGRVFWLLDFMVTAYLAWWLMSGRAGRSTAGRVMVLIVLGAFSLGRGIYVLAVETRRPIAEPALPPTPWTDAMRWLEGQPPTLHVLTDPGHAWKYGVGVRVAARKDTLLESVKDSAMAMYDRDSAIRVAERSAALAHFDEMTTDDIRSLDVRFGLDAFVVEGDRTFGFPVLYRNAQFVIYDLR